MDYQQVRQFGGVHFARDSSGTMIAFEHFEQAYRERQQGNNSKSFVYSPKDEQYKTVI